MHRPFFQRDFDDSIPVVTRMPFRPRRGRVVILADDENLRLGALNDHGRVVDYGALARRARSAFGDAVVHVFSVHGGVPAAPGVRVHQKRTPGKNADLELGLYWAREVAPYVPEQVIFGTGDHDFLVLHAEAVGMGASCGFLAPSRRSCSRHLLAVPHALLGQDVLRRPADRRWRVA